MKTTEQVKNEKKKVNKGSLGKLLVMLFPYWKLFVGCLLLTLLVNAAVIFKPAVMEIIIDDFLRNGEAQHGLYSVTGMGVLYFLLTLLGAAAALWHSRLITRMGQRILHDMRCRVFKHISHMSLTAFDRYSSGRLLTRATNDTDAINEFYTDVLINLFKDIVLILGISVMMLVMNWRLALVGFLAVPVIALISVSMKKKLKSNFQRMKQLVGRINGFFSENIDGMRTVQVFNREDEKYAEFDELNQGYFKVSLLQIRMHSLLRPLMEVVNNLAIALIIVYGCHGIMGGWLEVGIVYAFTTYIQKFFEPINDLADKYNTIQSAAVSAERILRFSTIRMHWKWARTCRVSVRCRAALNLIMYGSPTTANTMSSGM
jgi:ATP-binding cassette subfamily B protein